MSNIISFEDKKEDKELIELLEQFEKHMPTKEELEARINSIKDLYDFHYDIEISDEPITELDDLITDQYLHAIDDNRKQRSAEEFTADIESYIPTVYRAYEIIFDMLKSKDSRCRSLDMYTLMLSNLEYYPFLDYKLACERNREDQSK